MERDGTEKDGTMFNEDKTSDEHTTTDAKGFSVKIFSSSKKKTSNAKASSSHDNHADETDLTHRIPRYSANYTTGNFRGQAIIINNENFHRTTGMNKRLGTEADEKNLQRLLSKLDFNVKIYRDQGVQQISQIVHDASSVDHSEYDCFMMILLSHGDNGVIYGTDGTIEINRLTKLFKGKTCPSLIGKPKIFIFQACRGYKHEDPVEKTGGGDVVDGMDNEIVVDAGVAPTLPNASDFLFCYSVTEGFYSHRDTLYGSWYIQAFVEVFEEELINRGRESAMQHDILSLLTFVNYKVSRKSVERTRNPEALGKKQMPCFLSMLTKEFYLVPKT